mmetsp:Transcript_14018/g.24373  ORF Transcript_14018/g.24373 Transcript_14018/m.24373 type:complete len:456 (+) Transcript_14018:100-1467(+)|eukprot:CAMPEP_0171525582 /NCGR_PEP_ID=MMETSP0959-20130129/9824_1 /TAXON_ID=87120 /ORGANISM="Aurantiochytrium limacinum, Strain ATCCMYA-1381" /LENGTH=455 /DNA_ID=CAMNT_0012066723 /DNA_START=31 /DNA_END=1398 /DNA_ORIENTATION=-
MSQLIGQKSLEEHDPELFALIADERARQRGGLELIASENFTSTAVMETLGSCLTNKYAEGMPGKRYYGGNQIIDKVETMCMDRALKAYRLNPENWGVNVAPYSGSPANFAAFTAVLKPHDRIMGLDLPSGGHLTHGFYTLDKKTGERKAISATSVYFESLPYTVHPETGLIDFDRLADLARTYKPALIICGGSAYPREWDYKRFREIADENGALLLCDMAHISGLVATEEAVSPFDFADIVTTTTHKSLRGPRAAMIFYRKDERNFGPKVDAAVFPGLQGGPHENAIGAIATQLKEVMSPEFKQYAVQVRKNAQALGAALNKYGYSLATGGTDNHLLLWDLRPQGITGSKIETLCDRCHITLNKNAVPGDKSALSPGGVRIGTPALTTRGFVESDFEKVAEFLHRAVQIAAKIQEERGKALKDFKAGLDNNADLEQLKEDVHAFANPFPMPGLGF